MNKEHWWENNSKGTKQAMYVPRNIEARSYNHFLLTYFCAIAIFREPTPMLSTAFFWVIKQQAVVIPYRRFGTTYKPLEEGADRLPRKVDNKLLLFVA